MITEKWTGGEQRASKGGEVESAINPAAPSRGKNSPLGSPGQPEGGHILARRVGGHKGRVLQQRRLFLSCLTDGIPRRHKQDRHVLAQGCQTVGPWARRITTKPRQPHSRRRFDMSLLAGRSGASASLDLGATEGFKNQNQPLWSCAPKQTGSQ